MPDDAQPLASEASSTCGQIKPGREDAVALKAMLAQRAGDVKLDLGQVIRFAVVTDPSEEVASLIAAILDDRDMDRDVRLRAAAALGDLPFHHSRKALTRALPDADVVLGSAIIVALAKVGDSESARAIETLPDSNSDAVNRMRDFARALIAFRCGSDLDARTQANVVPTEVRFPIRLQPPELVAAVVENLHAPTFGISVRKDLALGFHCENHRSFVLINEELRGVDAIAEVQRRRCIAGIIVTEEERMDFVTRYLILTQPGHGSVDVSVVRPTGGIAFLGRLLSVENGLSVTLHDHDRERFPTRVEGTITDRAITLSAHVMMKSARAKNPGKPLGPT